MYTSIHVRSVNLQQNEYDRKMNVEKKNVLLQKVRYTNIIVDNVILLWDIVETIQIDALDHGFFWS